jgi:hypothetical protein
MDFGALRARVLGTNLSVHGVPATVTRPAPDDEPIETRGIWISPGTESVPVGSGFSRKEQQLVLALPRTAFADVSKLPRGTRIVAVGPDTSAGERTWQIDGFDGLERDHVRAIVIDVTED